MTPLNNLKQASRHRRKDGLAASCTAGPVLLAVSGYVLGGAPNYHIELLKCPAIGINNQGIALVTCESSIGVQRPYILRDKIYIELKMPPYCKANDDDLQAVAINNRNQVLVSCGHHFTPRTQFLYDIDHDTYRWIGTRGHVAFARQVDETSIGTMVAINDNGEVLTSFGVRFHGALEWTPGIGYGTPALSAPGAMVPPSEFGEFKPVPRTPCLGGARFTAINEHDDIAGMCALHKGVWSSFILSNGSFTEVAAPGAKYTEVKAMNNLGAVVGVFQPTKAQMTNHAFLFEHDRYTAVLDGPGSEQVAANGINDQGTIVGVTGKSVPRGFLATPSTEAGPAPGAAAALPGAQVDSIAPETRSRPKSPKPPVAATTAPTARGYFGTNASVSNGTLNFTVAGTDGGRPITFKGLLPIETGSPGGSTSSRMWIARSGAEYIVFTMIGPGVISGAPVSQAVGQQTYDSALRAQSNSGTGHE